MASVWLGRSLTPPRRLVALKVIRPEHGRNRQFSAMFVDEVRIASRLSHPNVIAIVGSGHDGRRHFLAMEVLRGRTLLETWERARALGRRLPYEVVAWVGARIADGLHHAHELRDDNGKLAQVVHRDVNPANVFLTREGVPKLIDFGLAKSRDRVTSTAVGVIKGKLAYLAPEQARGQTVDRRTDVFALGVTLWELTLNRRLFKEDEEVETLRRVREGRVPDPTKLDPTVPPDLAQGLMRALAREPKDRFATAAELRDALDAFVRSVAPVDEGTIRDLLAELFAGTPAPEWEQHASEADVEEAETLADADVEEGDTLSVWDDEAQKLTWIHASIETIPPPSALAAGSGPQAGTIVSRRDRLEAALSEHVSSLASEDDRVALARAHLERAIVDETLGDGSRAAEHATASLRAWPTSAAHGLLRRVLHAPGRALALLEHVDAEIAACPSEPARADLLAERARLLEAAGATPIEVLEAWERALDAGPTLPAALAGLEAALACDPFAVEAHAAHLARMADVYAGEPRLAAGLQVERALALQRLGRLDVSKAALRRALELDPRVGPVRRACVEHAVVQHDDEWLIGLLAEQASMADTARAAAALNVDAACIARYALGDPERALPLLELAAAGARDEAPVFRRALDELISIHERAGRARDALRVRRARLAHQHDPRARAYELRAIASAEEALADHDAAISTLESALEISPTDVTLAEALDRLLEGAARGDRRIELWVRVAACTTDDRERARRLMRASSVAQSLGDSARATLHLQAALVADPGSVEAVERLLRLETTPPGESVAAEARARIAVHAHAAEHSADATRRIAHLETLALLEELLLADPALAMATYQAILREEPGRRTALAGLARTASRCGDGARLASALLAEADAAGDSPSATATRVQAAEALAPTDPDRALAIALDVRARDPANKDALLIQQRLHETAGRWGQVDSSLAARIESASDDRERVDLGLARAELQRGRLRDPRQALRCARTALSIDPAHPGAREAVRQLLEALDDPQLLLEGLEELARTAATPSERACEMTRAADVAEHVLRDNALAATLYERTALGEERDPWIDGRRLRLLRRRAAAGNVAPLEEALTERLDRHPQNGEHAFDLALVRTAAGEDPTRIAPLAEVVLASDPAEPLALRMLERIARNTGDAARLADALARQADAVTAAAPRLAALWAHAAVLEWRAPGGDAEATVQRILSLAPDDRAAVDASLLWAWPKARLGDPEARERLVKALRARFDQAADDTETLWACLSIGLVLDPDDDLGAESVRAALSSYRQALAIDRRSVVAALETARLGAALGDAEAGVAAAIARAELVKGHQARAAFLVQAAGQIVSAQDPRLGERPERLARAATLLERALETDPEAIAAVALLGAVRNEDGNRDRLLAALRSAFERARSGPIVATLGMEVARVASAEPADRVLSIEALRRVLSVVPGDPPALRALADQQLAQGSWPEAVASLEAFAARALDPRAKLDAFFELAKQYDSVPGRGADVIRVLRAALEVDPSNVTALRDLLEREIAAGAPAPEIAHLLAQLGTAETAPEAKAQTLARLADLRAAADDRAGAEDALVEALAQAPSPARLKALLDLNDGAPAAQARSLAAAVDRSAELGRPDAACHAMLGELEGNVLGRWADAVPRFRAALTLDPRRHEVRAALAEGLVRTGASGDAAAIVLSMFLPDATPLLALAAPAHALSTLERALMAQGRPDEAMVARELRALAGGLDDGAHMELRARRLPIDPDAPVPVALDAASLRQNVVPQDAPMLCFELASALQGIDRKLVTGTLDNVGAEARDRLPSTSGHPLLRIVQRICTQLGIARPEIALAPTPYPRVVGVQDALWLSVPQVLLAHPEPVQAASVARPLVRMALGLSWLEGLPSAHVRAMLLGIGRQVVGGYEDSQIRDLVDDAARRIGRAVGRGQKKALTALATSLAGRRPPTATEVQEFERAVACAELRAAFVLTGDLLATLDAVRAGDHELAAATTSVGHGALAATLGHRLAGDVTRFAIAPATTALRWRAGTLWNPARAYARE